MRGKGFLAISFIGLTVQLREVRQASRHKLCFLTSFVLWSLTSNLEVFPLNCPKRSSVDIALGVWDGKATAAKAPLPLKAHVHDLDQIVPEAGSSLWATGC